MVPSRLKIYVDVYLKIVLLHSPKQRLKRTSPRLQRRPNCPTRIEDSEHGIYMAFFDKYVGSTANIGVGIANMQVRNARILNHLGLMLTKFSEGSSAYHRSVDKVCH